MKIYLFMLDKDVNTLSALQFEFNGYGPFVDTSAEADVIITDGRNNPHEVMDVEKVVIQLRPLNSSIQRLRENSEKFRFINMKEKGFGSFREAMDFLDSHFGNPVL